MTTTSKLVTADELLEMPDDGARYELIKGELRHMPPGGGEQAAISANFVGAFIQFVKANNLGVILTNEPGFQIASDPDTVRSPDMAFVRREQIPEGGLPRGYWPGVPDLAVEVISPFDSYAEVEERVIGWLTAGTRMVIVMNPRTRTVMVHTSPTEAIRLTEADVLSGGDVVPGFACQMSKLFA